MIYEVAAANFAGKYDEVCKMFVYEFYDILAYIRSKNKAIEKQWEKRQK